jgi:hypothetical protein
MIISKILLHIGVILVWSSIFFSIKASHIWMFSMIDENGNYKLDDEKKFNRLGWITFILGGIFGMLSFYISNQL